MSVTAQAPAAGGPKGPLHAYMQWADDLIGKAELAAAAALLAEADRHYPRQGATAWRRAEIEFRRGDRAAARARIRRAMRHPRSCWPRFYVIAARIARAMDDREWLAGIVKTGLGRFPHTAELLFQRGLLLARNQRWPEAARALELAVNLQPRFADAGAALAQALIRTGDGARAERVLHQALAPHPGHAGALNLLTDRLRRAGRLEEALALYRRALTAGRPAGAGLARILADMAGVLRQLHRFEESERASRRARILDPGHADILYNHGNLQKETGALRRAVASFDRALAARPGTPRYHWNRGLALLSAGRLAEGFRDYEWRWRHSDFPSRPRDFAQPQWDGAPFDGSVLLVHAEQGMGDHIQFARFVPQIARLGGRVILECHPPLLRLFAGFAGQVRLLERLAPPGDFDLHLPLLSAPLALGIGGLDSLPRETPYLRVPEDAGDDPPLPEATPDALNVGIVWGGNPDFPSDDRRSAAPGWFAPLLTVPGTRFFSLQKGPREAELADGPAGILPLGPRIGDFRDTASLMNRLDLIITTCTSTAHLAPALGRETWVLLSHNPDWRWLRGREDSPWYPTARLFRQDRPGDWAGVFARVRDALAARVGAA